MTNDKRDLTPRRALSDNALSRESWKIFQMMAEFVEGFERLGSIRPSVSMFGSARTPPQHPYYQLAEQIGRALSDAGFSVVSGGGPGIMEAANKGAYAGKSPSIGLNIQFAQLPAFLHPQGDVREICICICGAAGWFRYAG
jgi:predicted Rossmann-fold nucleotide-binding protein